MIWLPICIGVLLGSASPQAALARPQELKAAGPASPTDYLWTDQFGLPNVDGSIYCAVRFGGDLIVGGTFRQIGGVLVNNIARWDGVRWHPLGNGIDDEVSCLAVYHGSLFAGGRFQFVDGYFSPHLARWDGGSWYAVGAFSGTYYCCYAMNSLTVYRDELIAGGDFGTHEEPSLRGIRRWDGTFWRPLGTGVNGPVQTVLVVGDSLYVAGSFDSAGGADARRVALWDGSTWEPLGHGISSKGWGWGVRSLAWFQERLFAGGDFDSAGGIATGGLASWDGANWSAVEGFESGWVSAVAVHDGQLHVAKFPDLVRWDGVAWSGVSEEFRGEPRVLLPDGNDLIAAGSFDIGHQTLWGDPNRTLKAFEIARWDGSVWTSYEPWNSGMKGLAGFAGFPAPIHSLASFQGKLVAGGLTSYAGTGESWKVVSEVSEWDGLQWTGISFGRPGYSFGIPSAMIAEEDTLFVAGDFRFYPPSQLQSPVLRWDGKSWADLDTLSASGSCLARYGGTLMLGTTVNGWPGPPDAGVYAWSGTKWNSIGPTAGVDQFHGVSTLAVHDGLLVAGGSFTSIDGVTANGIAAWNGFSWQSLGAEELSYASLRPYVVDVASHRGALLAAGGFTETSGAVPLMVWDGVAWKRFPGIRGWASALSIVGGRLFLAGSLRIESSDEEATIVMWDGRIGQVDGDAMPPVSTWQPLGSGVNGQIVTLHEHDGSLYAGGYFSAAGGKSSFGVARWNGLPRTGPTGAFWLSQGRPNPFRATCDFSFEIKRSGRVHVAVHDVRGREVAVIENAVRSVGTYNARWDGRDRGGRRVAAGIYFISVRQANGAIASRKVALLN